MKGARWDEESKFYVICGGKKKVLFEMGNAQYEEKKKKEASVSISVLMTNS